MNNKKREPHHLEGFSFLLGYPDSNQERQDQNLQCYHYTIAQFAVVFLKRGANLHTFLMLQTIMSKKFKLFVF